MRRDLECSRAQERIWYAEQIADIGAANNMPLVIDLRGRLDSRHLVAALGAVIAAQPALRTTFEETDGRLTRVELDHGEAPRPALSVEPATRSIPELIARLSAQPLRLLHEPTRLHLLRITAGHHILLAIFHRAVCDEDSLAVFAGDLARAYGSVAAGSVPHLPSQRQACVKGDPALAERATRYWRTIIDELADAVPWPMSPHAVRGDDAAGEAIRFRIDPALTTRLQSVAEQHGTRLSVLFVAAVQVLQHVFGGRSDEPVASLVPLSARAPTVGRAIGMYVNDAPLLARPALATTFAGHLEATAERESERQSVRRFPFGDAVDRLGAGRDPWTLLPRVGIHFRSTGSAALDAGGVRFAADFGSPVYGRLWDVRFRVVGGPDGLSVSLEYDTSVLHRRGAERLAEHLRLLLSRVAAEPSTLLSSLDVLPAEERHRMLVTWNRTEVRHRHSTPQELFERQLERRADHDAVGFGDEVVSYRELNRRANRLAARLCRAGVTSGDLVAIGLERSIETVVAVLGVVKTGAAFLPLDPSAPVERLSFMLADSQACALVTDRPNDAPWARMPRLATYGPEAAGEAAGWNPPSSATPDDVAYVLYTSGSTGRPKGVEVLNAGLANVLQSMGGEPGLSATDTELAVASVSFDLAILELLGPLAAGARLIVAPSGAASDGEVLADLVRRWNVTYLHATPATWRLLIGAGWRGIATAVSGGEALTSDLARLLLSRATTVWNSYGPTETTIGSTLARVSDPDDVSIGRPIANTRLYVMDRAGQPVPLGAAGELYIGGVGVAKGYLNRPGLTRDRFLVHPELGRVYRTGDLVRQRDAGALEYLGRTDDQVKIRGCRVEPGEVQAALAALPEIEEAVVIATDGRQGKRLVAYLVETAGANVSVAYVRNCLARHLPEQMIPTAFAKLDRIPVSRSGKVDRGRLPPPDRALAAADYAPPATRVERLLARIWAEALGVDRVGAEDDFFVLGGHSLLAAEVAARSGEALGRAVPLRMIFGYPTVARLARALDSESPAPEHIPRAQRRRLAL